MWFFSAMIQAKSVGDNLFHLVYNGEGPTDSFLYITSGNEGEQVTVKVSNYQSFHSKQRGYQGIKGLFEATTILHDEIHASV